MARDGFLENFRDEFAKALRYRDEVDWPIVVTGDPPDSGSLARFAAGVLVQEKPWLIEGCLHSNPKGPPLVSRLSIEHFPEADVEVTGTVLRLPLATIRDRANAQLAPRALGLKVLAEGGGWGVTREDVERAEEAAKQSKKPKRGRRAKPREHYERIALRYLALLETRRDVLVALSDEEGVPRETVRDWVRKATKLGLLAPGKPGRAEKRPGPNLSRKEKDDG